MNLDVGKATWLPYTQPSFDSEPLNCHLNVLVQIGKHGGFVQSGWYIAEIPVLNLVEANFHSVWLDTEGRLVDSTPRQDNEE